MELFEKLINELKSKKRKGVEVILRTKRGPHEIENSLVRELSESGLEFSRPQKFWSPLVDYGVIYLEVNRTKVILKWAYSEKISGITSIREISEESSMDDLFIKSLSFSQVVSNELRLLSDSYFY
ncbi:hypothetical protein DRN46_05855 [Thermococci archaeon]|nr:MAG: hypothetical protein DRN46_05855 [Thermococci archaeon]RLF94590.1 MAG: hypothetical protein DRN52_04915 [Thermococci archaeon]